MRKHVYLIQVFRSNSLTTRAISALSCFDADDGKVNGIVTRSLTFGHFLSLIVVTSSNTPPCLGESSMISPSKTSSVSLLTSPPLDTRAYSGLSAFAKSSAVSSPPKSLSESSTYITINKYHINFKGQIESLVYLYRCHST